MVKYFFRNSIFYLSHVVFGNITCLTRSFQSKLVTENDDDRGCHFKLSYVFVMSEDRVHSCMSYS